MDINFFNDNSHNPQQKRQILHRVISQYLTVIDDLKRLKHVQDAMMKALITDVLNQRMTDLETHIIAMHLDNVETQLLEERNADNDDWDECLFLDNEMER